MVSRRCRKCSAAPTGSPDTFVRACRVLGSDVLESRGGHAGIRPASGPAGAPRRRSPPMSLEAAISIELFSGAVKKAAAAPAAGSDILTRPSAAIDRRSPESLRPLRFSGSGKPQGAQGARGGGAVSEPWTRRGATFAGNSGGMACVSGRQRLRTPPRRGSRRPRTGFRNPRGESCHPRELQRHPRREFRNPRQ